MTAADTEQPRDGLTTLVETMMQSVSRGTNGERSYPSGLSQAHCQLHYQNITVDNQYKMSEVPITLCAERCKENGAIRLCI